MKTREINSPNVFLPSSGYAQALEVADYDRLLFISGQIPIANDDSVPKEFSAQCELVWESLTAQLKAAGMDITNLVKVTILLASRDHLQANKEIRQRFCGDHKPALTIMFADMYDDAWLLEIEAIAAA